MSAPLSDSPPASEGDGPRRPRPVPRVTTLGVILAVLALAALTGRVTRRPAAPVAEVAMPVAAPAAAVSSSWFCAGPVASPSRLADGHLVIVNAAARALRGRVTLMPSNGPATSQDIQVDPGGQLIVPEKPSGGAPPYLGAVVDLDGGRAAVQQVVTGSEGTSSTACATSGSTSWYFPTGTTQESATLSLTLVNPYPDDAIADLSFTTEQGQESPQDFQGIVVPARSVVGLDLGSHLRLRAAIATTVSLRVGRVAAFETQAVQSQSAAAAANQAPGTAPWPPGMTLVRGAPASGTAWWWPSGEAGDGATEQYVIYNPGRTEAQVSLQPDLDQGSADPFQLSVDPHAVAVVTTNSESRIPKGVGHAAGLRVTSGGGVVAARLALSTAPAGPTGVTAVLGSRLEAGRWLLPGDSSSDSVSAALVIYNPAAAPVTVSISSLQGALPGQGAVVIAGRHRYLLTTAAPASNPALAGPLLVAAPAPVVVERDVAPAKAVGMDESIAVPLSS